MGLRSFWGLGLFFLPAYPKVTFAFGSEIYKIVNGKSNYFVVNRYLVENTAEGGFGVALIFGR